MDDHVALLMNAIDDRRRVLFTYEGLPRLVEPYILSRTADGHLILTGWQVAGLGTGWRIFQVNSLNALRLTELVFDGQRMLSEPHAPASEVIHRISRLPQGGL